MSLRFRRYSDFLGVFGRKGRGKTNYTIWVIKPIRRKIMIDPTWQTGNVPLGYVVHYPHRLEDALEKFPSVVYQPKPQDDDSYCQVFGICLKYSNYTLVVDEVDMFARPRWYMCDQFKELIRRGRAQGIGLICNSRRPASMHNDIRSNADWVVCFQLHEDRDLEYMSNWIGVEEETIKTLKPYHSLLWNVDEHRVVKQSPCPKMT